MRSLRRSLLLSCWKRDSRCAVRIFEIIDMDKKASVKVRRLRWPTKADVFFVMATRLALRKESVILNLRYKNRLQRNLLQSIK